MEGRRILWAGLGLETTDLNKWTNFHRKVEHNLFSLSFILFYENHVKGKTKRKDLRKDFSMFPQDDTVAIQ